MLRSRDDPDSHGFHGRAGVASGEWTSICLWIDRLDRSLLCSAVLLSVTLADEGAFVCAVKCVIDVHVTISGTL